MGRIRIANAPCSWGVLEFDLQGKAAGYEQVLKEMAESGYAGSEFGDWGFMPTDPKKLRAVFDKIMFGLPGAFVPTPLAEEDSLRPSLERVLKVADLLFRAGFEDAFIILSDENGKVPLRVLNAGRVTPDIGLTEAQWATFARGADSIAEAVKRIYGLRTVFHHHCGGYVETVQEVEQLIERTSDLIGICLDTGHLSFAGGDPLQFLKRYGHRIRHIHFKDYDSEVGNTSGNMGYNYFESVKNGVFCELGKGNVNFRGIVDELKRQRYSGWIVVEQDVLPGMGNPKLYAERNMNFIKTLDL